MKIKQVATAALWVLAAVSCGPMVESGPDEELETADVVQAQVSAPSSVGSFFCVFTGPTVSGTVTDPVRSTAKSLARSNALSLCQATFVCPVREVEDCCAGGQEFCVSSQCPVVQVPTECVANAATCTPNANGTYTCTSTAGCCSL